MLRVWKYNKNISSSKNDKLPHYLTIQRDTDDRFQKIIFLLNEFTRFWNIIGWKLGFHMVDSLSSNFAVARIEKDLPEQFIWLSTQRLWVKVADNFLSKRGNNWSI